MQITTMNKRGWLVEQKGGVILTRGLVYVYLLVRPGKIAWEVQDIAGGLPNKINKITDGSVLDVFFVSHSIITCLLRAKQHGQ